MDNKSLLEIINPKSNSTVLVYDVHASESGALSILNDFYVQVRNYSDKSVKWVFIVSKPDYAKSNNIKVERYPWVKKSWFHRLFFENITTKKILKKYKPDIVFSLQNKGINNYNGKQIAYLHLPFILTNYKFKFFRDGKQLWLYQNVLKKIIFNSLRKVNKVIVQTKWMKDELIKQANINGDNIVLCAPNINMNNIGKYKQANKITFFYPATAFFYKNHITILKAINYLNNKISNYEIVFTINEKENKCSKELKDYANKFNINVRFIGKMSRDKVFQLYEKSILLFPSYVESFGLPLLEARETKCPIIASDQPFSREILKDYDGVLYYKTDDYIDMAYKIEIMVNKLRG